MTNWSNLESSRKILVIGDIMLNQYVIGTVRCFCPEILTSVLEETETSYYPGGAAGVAANIKNMGGQVILAGVVGKDEEGEVLRRILNQRNIPAVLGVDSIKPTTVKKRIGTRKELVIQLDKELAGDVSPGIFHDILKVMTILSEDIKLVCVSDYGKGVVTRELIETICEVCRSKDIPVIADTVGHDFSKYQGVNVLKASFQSMEALNGNGILKMEDLEKTIELLFTASDCQACIVSLFKSSFSNGIILFRSPQDWIHYPEHTEQKAMCFCNAEEVFMASLAVVAAQGFTLEFSCRTANEAVLAAYL